MSKASRRKYLGRDFVYRDPSTLQVGDRFSLLWGKIHTLTYPPVIQPETMSGTMWVLRTGYTKRVYVEPGKSVKLWIKKRK